MTESSGERKISKDKYILAGFITLLLFMLGLILGLLIDTERLQWLEDQNKEQELDFKSIQLQYLYLTNAENNDYVCPVLQATLQQAVADLSKSLDRYQNFEENTQINSESYRAIGRQYVLDNVNYWLLARKSKDVCGLNVLNVLYFYKKECSSCPDQGVILTYFKNILGDKFLVYPIDADIAGEEPVVGIVQARHNITIYPTIIVEEKKYEGVVGREDMKKIICTHLNETGLC